MTQDNELVGIGICFITAAAIMLLALSGTVDLTALHWEAVRLAAGLQSLLSSVAALLPL